MCVVKTLPTSSRLISSNNIKFAPVHHNMARPQFLDRAGLAANVLKSRRQPIRSGPSAWSVEKYNEKDDRFFVT
jgi:hypothetical protein